MNVASLDVQKMSKTSFEGFMFFEFISSIHGVFDWIHVFIIHSSLWHTSFRNIFQYLLQQKTNHKELQRTTATHNNSKKNAKRFATVTQRHKTVEIMSTMTHNNAKQIQTLHKNWSFALKISSVNVSKSATSCGFGHTYRRNT